MIPLRATIGVTHVATPARWLDDASLCSCVFNLRQHQSAAAAPRTVLDFLIPNGLSYPETMIFSRNRLGRIDNSDHDRHRHKRDVPVMPFAEASPGHARAIAKRLRHDIRMHVTMRVAHIDMWGWLLTRALAVLDCACVHAYAVRSARTRDQICLPSVERMRAEPSLLGTLHVAAGLGGIAEVYERVSGDTIGSCVICSIIACLN